MRTSFSVLSLVLITMQLTAQGPPGIEWQRCLGTPGGDEHGQAIATSNGGFLLVGSTNMGTSGWNGIAIRTDADGNELWSRTYGGTMDDKLRGGIALPGGGYILLGYTTSNDGDVSGNHGQGDAWLLRIDGLGNLVWQKCLGGPGYDLGNQVIQTSNYDLLISCTASGAGGDVPSALGGGDAWLIRADTLGNILWSSILGGSSDDLGGSIIEADNGILFNAATQSTDGLVSQSFGNWDIWILRLSDGGELIEERSYGGSQSDGAFLRRLDTGGYVLIGSTESNDGMITPPSIGGLSDIWLCWLDENLNPVQQARYGGLGYDSPAEALPMPDGGWLIGGIVSGGGGDVTGHHGGFYDIWCFRIDAQGDLLWQRALGGSADDRGGTLTRASDGAVLVLGTTNSTDGDVTGLFPGYDIWAVKLGPDFTSVQESSVSPMLDIHPNPSMDQARISFTLARTEAVIIVQRNALGAELQRSSLGVLSAGPHTMVLSVNDWSQGSYLIEVQSKSQRLIAQLMKE